MSGGEMRDPLRQPHVDEQYFSALGFSSPGNSSDPMGHPMKDKDDRLLSQLRRPDFTQIPPDVLAPIVLNAPALLRNAHLEGDKEGELKQGNNKNKGNWNPNAVEFVPSMMDGSNQLALALSNLDVSQDDAYAQEGPTVVLETLTDVIQQLTSNPADFDRCANDLESTLNQWLSESHMLGITVTLIIEQSISHRNFCYSGARLCKYLENVSVGKETFKTMLIAQVQEIFSEVLEKLKGREGINEIERSKGLAAFFAELFMNMRVKNEPISIYGLAATELMRKIVAVDGSASTVKSMTQIFKLIGWECDNSKNKKLVDEADQLFRDLTHILAMDETSPAAAVIKALVALKKRNWDKEPEEAKPSLPSYDASPLYELPEALEDEAFSGEFLEDPNCDGEFVLDDEPDGVMDAYDEFLAGLQ